MKVKITSDSPCNLSAQQLEENGIDIICTKNQNDGNVFEKYVDEGYQIVHFCIEPDTTSYKQACISASICDEIYIIDARSFSHWQELILLYAVKLAENGANSEEIASKYSQIWREMIP